MCDSRSVDVELDFVPSDSVFPHNVAETLQVFHNKAHSWWFLGDQCRDEVLLFKIFDSDETVARCKWIVIKTLDGILSKMAKIRISLSTCFIRVDRTCPFQTKRKC